MKWFLGGACAFCVVSAVPAGAQSIPSRPIRPVTIQSIPQASPPTANTVGADGRAEQMLQSQVEALQAQVAALEAKLSTLTEDFRMHGHYSHWRVKRPEAEYWVDMPTSGPSQGCLYVFNAKEQLTRSQCEVDADHIAKKE